MTPQEFLDTYEDIRAWENGGPIPSPQDVVDLVETLVKACEPMIQGPLAAVQDLGENKNVRPFVSLAQIKGDRS
jgi:hypothetical protein